MFHLNWIIRSRETKFNLAIGAKNKLRAFRFKIEKNFFSSLIGEIENAGRILHGTPRCYAAF